MESEFDPDKLTAIVERIDFRLRQTFESDGYVVFDVKLVPRPENVSPDSITEDPARKRPS